MTVRISAVCTACGGCVVTCPERALVPAAGRPHVVDALCTDCLACLEVCPVDAVHPIEVESYRRMEARVDFSGWASGERAVVARMVHATADESFATTARIGEDAVAAALAALRSAAPVVCDSRMVLAGVPSVSNALCLLDEVSEVGPGDTRSAAALRLAAAAHPEGALWVVGNAPTALAELLALERSGLLRPAAVIGLPVGYVGAAEAKAALWAGPLRRLAVTNVGERGGSAVAAAAVNALARLAAGS